MNISDIPPGSVVSTSHVFFRHVGVMTECGTVISNSKKYGCVAEESLAVFADGQRVSSEGYPGRDPAGLVLARARSQIGKPWNLFSNNCEHFVRNAHGMAAKSPQLRNAARLAAVFAGAFLLSRRT